MSDSCLACGSPSSGEPVCLSCAHDPFLTEQARKSAAKRGLDGALRRLYGSDFAFFKEGHVPQRWDDILRHDKNAFPEFTLWRNAASVRLVPREARQVLEVGIGMGHAIRELSLRMPAAELYGIDASPQAVDSASQRFKGRFAAAKIEELPWPGVLFDAILMLEVLEHIEVTRTFSVLEALRSRLAPGGRLILSVPLISIDDLRRAMFLCPHCGEFVDPIGHIRSYSDLQPIEAELSLAGFEVECRHGLAGGKYLGVPRQWLQRIFPGRVKPMVMIFRCRARAS